MPRSGDCTGHEAAKEDEPSGDAAKPAQPDEAKPNRQPPGSQLPPETREKLKALGVTKLPPTEATDLSVRDLDAPDVDEKPVMAWRDTKGRIQMAYTKAFHERNAAAKFERIAEIEPNIGEIRGDLVDAVVAGEHGTSGHAATTVAALIAHTGMRPGSPGSAAEGHFGATTLLPEHVKVEDGKVSFDFVGKSGKDNHFELDGPPELIEAVEAYLADATEGQPVFPSVSRNTVAAQMPEGVKVKDMRTVKATETARALLDQHQPPPPPLPNDPKKAKKAVLAVVKEISGGVAKTLNNTPAVAKASYIHPVVFEELERRLGVTEAHKQ